MFPVRYMDGSMASGLFSFLMNYACHRKGTAWYWGYYVNTVSEKFGLADLSACSPFTFLSALPFTFLRDPVSELL